MAPRDKLRSTTQRTPNNEFEATGLHKATHTLPGTPRLDQLQNVRSDFDPKMSENNRKSVCGSRTHEQLSCCLQGRAFFSLLPSKDELDFRGFVICFGAGAKQEV